MEQQMSNKKVDNNDDDGNETSSINAENLDLSAITSAIMNILRKNDLLNWTLPYFPPIYPGWATSISVRKKCSLISPDQDISTRKQKFRKKYYLRENTSTMATHTLWSLHVTQVEV